MEAIAERTAQDDVRALLDSYFAAIRAGDIDGIIDHYAAGIVAYDAISQLEFVGRDAYRAHWKACLEMCQTTIFEPRDLAISEGDGLAVAHGLIHCGGVGPDGTEGSGWMRMTLSAKKREGVWLIVHEHYSMPFDPMSGKMLDDLEPAE